MNEDNKKDSFGRLIEYDTKIVNNLKLLYYGGLLKSQASNEELLKIIETFNLNLKINTSLLKTQISNLIDAYKSEELVLVLGAGISIPYDVPDWNTLLKTLLIESNVNSSSKQNKTSKLITEVYANLFNINPLITARYLQEIFQTDKHNMGFESAIQKLLYNSINREIKSDTMDEIVKLCISPGKNPNIDSIITYNYDDILEKKIYEKNLGVRIKPIYTAGSNPKNGETPIYHVHGYLPSNEKLNEQHSITLSESIYHQQYLDVYSWNNIVQLNKFTDKTCLFIGSSFTDPNIRRLMDIAKKQRGGVGKHYIIKKKIGACDIEDKIKDEILRSNIIRESNNDNSMSLTELMKKIIEMNQLLEEKDAQSFGCEIIWINNYENDLPLLLKSIRTMKQLSNLS